MATKKKAKATTKGVKRGSAKTKAEIEAELRAQGFRKERKITSVKLKKAQSKFKAVNERASMLIYQAGKQNRERPSMGKALKEAARDIYRGSR